MFQHNVHEECYIDIIMSGQLEGLGGPIHVIVYKVVLVCSNG